VGATVLLTTLKDCGFWIRPGFMIVERRDSLDVQFLTIYRIVR
jgi:hypothetical protein